MRWKLTPKPSDIDDPPITFTVWVNDAGGHTWNITVEYEWKGPDALKDVTVTIPYSTSEPAVSSFDAVYEVSGDSIDWTIGTVDDSNANGSFEFEAQAADEGELFPMAVHFSKTKPFVDIDVSYPDHQCVCREMLTCCKLGRISNVTERRARHQFLEGYQVCCGRIHHRLRRVQQRVCGFPEHFRICLVDRCCGLHNLESATAYGATVSID